MNKTLLTAALTAGLMFAATGAQASDDRYGAKPQMSATELVQSLEAQGYTNIRDIELDDGLWEVEANDPAGREVDLKIDPSNGVILEADYDD